MNKFLVRVFSLMLLVGMTGCASTIEALNSSPEDRYTPEQFAGAARINNTSLDVAATISTGSTSEYRLNLSMYGDIAQAFIQASVNKQTGDITYSVIAEAFYTGDWRFYDTVNYLTASGPVQRSLTAVDRNFKCESSLCKYHEVVSFPISQDLIRQLASYHVQNVSAPWTFRISKSGQQQLVQLRTAEIAGAVLAAERVATNLGHPPKNPFQLRQPVSPATVEGS